MNAPCRTAAIAVFVLVASCGGSQESSVVATPIDDLPAAVDVCIHLDGAEPQPGHAVPSRAGVWDPAMAVDPSLLNWMVEGAGCVSWPDPASPRIECSPGGPRPRVVRVLCQQ